MIHINKRQEPREFTEYRQRDYAYFDGMSIDVKDSLRDSLLREQGYICAYCMKRISDSSNTKIEHYVARTDDNQLEYRNLLAVCKGNEGNDESALTCDSRKGNRLLHINPQTILDMENIYYSSQGKIFSVDNIFKQDLDDVLNLNYDYGYLVANRKAALEQLKEKMHKVLATGNFTNYLERLYCKYAEMNDTGKYTEYVGIIRWYLEKKRRRCSNRT